MPEDSDSELSSDEAQHLRDELRILSHRMNVVADPATWYQYQLMMAILQGISVGFVLIAGAVGVGHLSGLFPEVTLLAAIKRVLLIHIGVLFTVVGISYLVRSIITEAIKTWQGERSLRKMVRPSISPSYDHKLSEMDEDEDRK